MDAGPNHSVSLRRPFLAGVTGGIGAGKSAVCAIIAERHPVLASDAIAKELLESDEELRQLVAGEFGSAAYDADGKLNRTFLADTVFTDPDKLSILNDIVHPATVEEMLRRVDALREQGRRLVFVESALLFEAGVHVLYDCIVAVVADRERILERMKDGAISPEDAARRMSSQLSQEEKAKRADFIIRNNGTLDDLRRNTQLILTIIESMAERDAAS